MGWESWESPQSCRVGCVRTRVCVCLRGIDSMLQKFFLPDWSNRSRLVTTELKTETETENRRKQ